MKRIACRLLSIVTTVACIWTLSSQSAAAKGHPLTEDAALNLLLQVLKKDHIYDKRISLNCVTFATDETTRIYFEIALRENHSAKCGGDPDLSPVVDRYRVYRVSGKIERYDAAGDQWRFYNGGLRSRGLN